MSLRIANDSNFPPAIIVAAAGWALAPAASWGQTDPLREPFPAVIRLAELDGRIGFKLVGLDRGDYAGWSVASAGDFNADGMDDLLVGAFGARYGGLHGAGSSFVVFGRPSSSPWPSVFPLAGLDGSNGVRFDGAGLFDSSGIAVGQAGDLNGDGVVDIAIGASNARPFGMDGAGACFVVFGRSVPGTWPAVMSLADLDGVNGFHVAGVAALDRTGRAVASAGDINGDGVDDLVVGAPYAEPTGRISSGSSFVVFGRRPGTPFPVRLPLADLDGENGFRLDGVDEFGISGMSVASAGDFNGDGVDDVLIGAPRANVHPGYFNGVAYLVFGRAAGAPFEPVVPLDSIDGRNGIRMFGDEYDQCGTSVAKAGDLNGDGLDDIFIGAPGGRSSYVVFGRAGSGPFESPLDLSALDGINGFRLVGPPSAGRSVASAGDVNGDGIDDLVIGAPGVYDPGPYPSVGNVFIVFGRRPGDPFPSRVLLTSLNGTNGFRLIGIAPGDQSGISVAAAGDLNGDGVGDIVVGAKVCHPYTRCDPGESYVVFGRDLNPCLPDLDADGALTVFDFLTFLNLFQDADPRADFDGDGQFTIFDFLAFQSAFDAGCP